MRHAAWAGGDSPSPSVDAVRCPGARSPASGGVGLSSASDPPSRQRSSTSALTDSRQFVVFSDRGTVPLSETPAWLPPPTARLLPLVSLDLVQLLQDGLGIVLVDADLGHGPRGPEPHVRVFLLAEQVLERVNGLRRSGVGLGVEAGSGLGLVIGEPLETAIVAGCLRSSLLANKNEDSPSLAAKGSGSIFGEGHGPDLCRPHGANGLWAELMRRSLGLDVLACPRCGARLTLIALIEDGAFPAVAIPLHVIAHAWLASVAERQPVVHASARRTVHESKSFSRRRRPGPYSTAFGWPSSRRPGLC